MDRVRLAIHGDDERVAPRPLELERLDALRAPHLGGLSVLAPERRPARDPYAVLAERGLAARAKHERLGTEPGPVVHRTEQRPAARPAARSHERRNGAREEPLAEPVQRPPRAGRVLPHRSRLARASSSRSSRSGRAQRRASAARTARRMPIASRRALDSPTAAGYVAFPRAASVPG